MTLLVVETSPTFKPKSIPLLEVVLLVPKLVRTLTVPFPICICPLYVFDEPLTINVPAPSLPYLVFVLAPPVKFPLKVNVCPEDTSITPAEELSSTFIFCVLVVVPVIAKVEVLLPLPIFKPAVPKAALSAMDKVPPKMVVGPEYVFVPLKKTRVLVCTFPNSLIPISIGLLVPDMALLKVRVPLVLLPAILKAVTPPPISIKPPKVKVPEL